MEAVSTAAAAAAGHRYQVVPLDPSTPPPGMIIRSLVPLPPTCRPPPPLVHHPFSFASSRGNPPSPPPSRTCRPSPSSCPPFDYVIPPRPQSSNYIHSSLRLADSGGSNSVHLSLRANGYDSNDRTTTTTTTTTFIFFSFFFPHPLIFLSSLPSLPSRSFFLHLLASPSFNLEPIYIYRYYIHYMLYVYIQEMQSY